jgi:phosphoglycerate dehydrogenase-like enzyme
MCPPRSGTGNVRAGDSLYWDSGGRRGDVFAQEPLATDSPLFDVPNLLLTPHVSGTFQGLWDLVVELFCENLSRYLANRLLLNLAHRERGY